MNSDSPLTNNKGLSVKYLSKKVSPCHGMRQANAEGSCSFCMWVKLPFYPPSELTAGRECPLPTSQVANLWLFSAWNL